MLGFLFVVVPFPFAVSRVMLRLFFSFPVNELLLSHWKNALSCSVHFAHVFRTLSTVYSSPKKHHTMSGLWIIRSTIIT